MSQNDDKTFIALKGIVKQYGGVTALDEVDFRIKPGEAIGLAGENGSGKSTLIKILVGVEQPTSGQIFVDGRPYSQLNPRLAAASGVSVIFQDFSLFGNLTVAENIAFAIQLSSKRRLFDRSATRKIAQEALDRIGIEIDLDSRVENIPVAHKQLVAICRGLASNARLIIMDEPTSALTGREVQALLGIIRKLKDDGIAVVFVSHKLAEVLEVCEEVFVLRNGKNVANGPARDFDAVSLTRHMTGRDVPEAQQPVNIDKAETLLVVDSLGKEGAFAGVSFALKAGEVLGISGVLGSGRTSLAKALFGLVTPDQGGILLSGKAIPLGDPIAATQAGIGYVPEDRLTEGLFLTQSIIRNVSVRRFDHHHRSHGFIDLVSLVDEARGWIERLRIKAPDLEAEVKSLSGGNQQRVALARWLSQTPRVLVLNGPSVGVDVGSKADIHGIIRELAESGIGIVVISDDLPELLATCGRILVMKDGRIDSTVMAGDIDEIELAAKLAS
jgi:simple sugar transport system ATP-binding protein